MNTRALESSKNLVTTMSTLLFLNSYLNWIKFDLQGTPQAQLLALEVCPQIGSFLTFQLCAFDTYHRKCKGEAWINREDGISLPAVLSAFYLPCKIWRLNFSMLQKIFIRVKFFLCRLQIVFPCCKIVYYAALTGIVFSYLYKNFQKMPIVKVSWPNL